MVELRLDPPAGEYRIRSYQPGAISINHDTYSESLIISANSLITKWKPKTINELTSNDWQPILDQEPAIVIIGTGPQIVFPEIEHLTPLIERNIGYEIMDTASACRTYTVLVAEDRRVVAVLFP
ncbi:MAG: Mth938-like domain-containing protein [Pseudomonadota bacterium]|nr:Mth938-like domain-containing protein [Pseudomonadota bacterium]